MSSERAPKLRNVVTQQAYKYALEPTPRQQCAFSSHAGAARFAYNWGIARVADSLDAYAEQKAAGIDEPDVKFPGHFDLCKMWTAWKNTAEWTDRHTGQTTTGVPWVASNFVGTYQAALRDAAGAWQRFFRARKTGARAGRPRFKKRGRARDSFQLHGDGLRIVDAKHVNLPKIGTVKTFEATRKLARRLAKGSVPCPTCRATGKITDSASGKVKKCSDCKAAGSRPAARIVRGTVARDSAGRWYLALTVELVREVRTAPTPRQLAGGPVGVDFGVRQVATLSTGQLVDNPRHLESHLRRVKTAQQALSRCPPGSRRRAKAQQRLGRLHARVRHLRENSLQQATSALIHQHSVIAVEGWDVQQTAQHASPKNLPKQIRRNRNRALLDTGIGAARWQLQSKGAWYGTTVVVTDRHAPTGRQCSACGTVKATPIPPTQDEYRCPACGTSLDRRTNTARVLAAVAAQHHDAPSGGESKNARGENTRPTAPRRNGQFSAKREPRSRPPGRGQTGTPGT